MIKFTLILFNLLLWSHQALAVGVGQAALHSHLGEPLDVRVPLIMEKGEFIQQFKVQLASLREYQNLEQVPPKSYQDIRVDVITSSSTTPEVKIHSSYAVDEAIFVLVLKVKRGRGVFYKKIQLFLDAVDIRPSKKTAWVSQPSEQVKYTVKQPSVVSPKEQQVSPSFADADGWARRNRYGPVQYGDSLSEIAYRLRKDKRWSNQQIMLALFDANPEAFINQNINQLKKGHFLKVPDDAAVQQLVSSARYTTLKTLRNTKKVKQENRKKVSKLNLVEPIQSHAPAPLRGRISLGLTKTLAASAPAPDINPEVLQRLDKLEPMYQQAMVSGLRLDGMDTKVEALAKEVGQLRHKVDALSRMKPRLVQEGSSNAWFWFIALLLLNIVIFAAYFYRKQMKIWQNKLVEAQQSAPQPSVYKEDGAEEEKQDRQEDDILPSLDQADEGSADKNQAVGLDEYDSMIGADVSGSHDRHELEVITIDDMPSMAEEALNEEGLAEDAYVNLFEEMVHKKDWVQAENYYELMDEKEGEKPRMQALWVQTMHGANRVMERNLTLLNLSKIYEHDEWHRFCSYFDQTVWQEMQDEKIISYTGKVVEAEMDKMNQEAMLGDAEIQEDVSDLALEDPDSLPDFHPTTYFARQDPMKDDSDAEEQSSNAEAQGSDDVVMDMGTVDVADVEPIMDIIDDGASQEDESLIFSIALDVADDEDMANGEDDTVVVTPAMLAAMAQKKLETSKEGVENHQKLSLESDQNADAQALKDKGDTVFVSREKMDEFRKSLDK